MAEPWAEECQEDLQMTGNVTENQAAMLTFWQKTCFLICIYCSVRIGFSIECLFCVMMMLWHWPILVVLSQKSHLHFWQCFQTCWRAIRFVICAEDSGVVVGWLVSQGCSFYEPLFFIHRRDGQEEVISSQHISFCPSAESAEPWTSVNNLCFFSSR